MAQVKPQQVLESQKTRRIKGTGGTERTDRKAIIPADDKKQRTGIGYAENQSGYMA